MKFTPMSAEEIALAGLLEPGIYPFEVMAASEELSKNGNEMIKLKLAVFGTDGQQVHVFDYLLEKLAYKIRHFCEHTGMLDKYEKGTLSELDCEGKAGYVQIVIDPANGVYMPKNSVKDYVKSPDKATPQPQPRPMSAVPPLNPAPGKAATPASLAAAGMNAGGSFDDDLPF